MKTKLTAKNIFRAIIFSIGVFALINGIVLCFTTNFNLGNLLTLILGVVLFFWAAFPKRINEILPKFIRYAIITALLTVLIFTVFLLSFGTSDTVNYKEDVIIVLGAAVHGETPSRALKDRLETAVEYGNKNPNALIVVSGGKGSQENISEADAMEKYLIKKGVSPDRIIKEDKSTSTYENFVNSKKLLDALFPKGYTTGFITNEYHIYRAGGMAEAAGFESITHTNSSTRWYSVLPGTLREILAVMKFWVLGN